MRSQIFPINSLVQYAAIGRQAGIVSTTMFIERVVAFLFFSSNFVLSYVPFIIVFLFQTVVEWMISFYLPKL